MYTLISNVKTPTEARHGKCRGRTSASTYRREINDSEREAEEALERQTETDDDEGKVANDRQCVGRNALLPVRQRPAVDGRMLLDGREAAAANAKGSTATRGQKISKTGEQQH